jgi:glutamate--cysteine ligase
LRRQEEKVRDAERTPSARMISEMRSNQEGFFEYARRASQRNRDDFSRVALDPQQQARFERLSLESWERQRELETADDAGFDEFLERYFAQE